MKSPIRTKKRRNTKPLHHHLFGKVGNTVLAIAIIGAFAASVVITRHESISPQMAAVISSSLVDMTNADRRAKTLGILSINPELTAAAQSKANDEAAKGYFAHTSPDGHNSWYWFTQAGYHYKYAGENLAVDFTDSKDVENAWLASPTHRANILNPQYTEIGIATAEGTYEGHHATFVVQMFGTPAEGQVTTQDAGVETGATSATNNVTSPAHTNALKYFYLLITVAILLTLVIRTRMELKVQHLKHAGVGAIALLSMLLLLLVADQLSYLAPLLPSVAASAVNS